eukprot:1074372-Prymnesium_polylepis.1
MGSCRQARKSYSRWLGAGTTRRGRPRLSCSSCCVTCALALCRWITCKLRCAHGHRLLQAHRP